MRAIARRDGAQASSTTVEIRDAHVLTADEPQGDGGDDEAPSPQELLAASLASCTAITMEMYAQRKGWDVGDVEVDVDYEPAQRGSPTRFEMVGQAAEGAARGPARAADADRREVPRAPHARGRGHLRRADRADLAGARVCTSSQAFPWPTTRRRWRGTSGRWAAAGRSAFERSRGCWQLVESGAALRGGGRLRAGGGPSTFIVPDPRRQDSPSSPTAASCPRRSRSCRRWPQGGDDDPEGEHDQPRGAERRRLDDAGASGAQLVERRALSRPAGHSTPRTPALSMVTASPGAARRGRGVFTQ